MLSLLSFSLDKLSMRLFVYVDIHIVVIIDHNIYRYRYELIQPWKQGWKRRKLNFLYPDIGFLIKTEELSVDMKQKITWDIRDTNKKVS